MYFLKKVFQLRDNANPEMEKPFLEHLEDLRILVTRVVLTLLISMIACFAFQKQLMDVLRKPVEEVWMVHTAKSLPKSVDLRDWEAAKHLHVAAVGLDPEERLEFLAQFDDQTKRLIKAVKLMTAADLLPVDGRKAFLKTVIGDDQDLSAVIEELRKTGASPVIGQAEDLNQMSALRPTETFMLSMKLSFFAGVIVSFPFLLYFILQFILPGLHEHETKLLWPAMAIGFGLFLLGVFFAYFIVLPRALVFFFEWGLDMGISNEWRIGEYISFATQFTLLFGLSFELPVVIMAFVKLGLLNYETMSRTRAYAVLAIVVAAAVITPTGDMITLSMMAVPMYILYEICIWLARIDSRKAQAAAEAPDEDQVDRLIEHLNDEPAVTEEGEEADIGDDLHDHFDDQSPRGRDDEK